MLLYSLRKQVFKRLHDHPTVIDHVKVNVNKGVYDSEILDLYSEEEFAKLQSFIDHDRDYLFTDSEKGSQDMSDPVTEVTTAMKEVSVKPEDDSQVKKGDEGSIYTSETRGNDEAGEGTYRVPFKSVMKVSVIMTFCG